MGGINEHLKAQTSLSPECPIQVICPDSYESDRQMSVSVTSDITNELAAWFKKKKKVREGHVFKDYFEIKENGRLSFLFASHTGDPGF